MEYLFCFDGGGTKLETLIVNSNLELVSFSRSGGVNMNFSSPEIVKNNIKTALEGCFKNFNGEISSVSGVILCPPEIFEPILYKYIKKDIPIKYLEEGKVGILAGTCSRYGFLALSGTGSDAFYVGENGDYKTVGGWGILLGDEGSGAWIGRNGIIACICAHENRGEKTDMLNELLKILIKDYNLENETDNNTIIRNILDKIYSSPNFRNIFSSFAPIVSKCADEGDIVAIKILEDAGKEIGFLLRSLIKNVKEKGEKTDHLPITISGGAWKGSTYFYNSFLKYVNMECNNVKIVWPYFEAIVGPVVDTGFNWGYTQEEILDTLLKNFSGYKYPKK